MAGERKRGGRGRPRDLAKLEAILDAAYALFLERGVAATTMDAVAERACVSKMTVYANLRTSPPCSQPVLDRKIKVMHLLDLPAGPDLEISIEHLIKVGETVVAIATQPEVIRMDPAAGRRGRRSAATIGGHVLHRGTRRIVETDRGLPEIPGPRGFLSINDPELAADQLMGACIWHERAAPKPWRERPRLRPEAIAKGVRHAVDTMIRARHDRCRRQKQQDTPQTA